MIEMITSTAKKLSNIRFLIVNFFISRASLRVTPLQAYSFRRAWFEIGQNQNRLAPNRSVAKTDSHCFPFIEDLPLRM
ncbi:hypothetical protein [Labrys monachus]|uniref:Secreted protein n=1 Tax=Labrys monachus TaxID=217067 RepID=A0ABU0FMA3_9HYPH|nr:hypothetical protein [Labrys monachus]MDQ0395740.1 hypothetical protein [Labrys monachus]